MKVFVWQRIKQCTSSYHPEGGVVVFAETEERARQLVGEYVEPYDDKPRCVIGPDEKPDEVREVIGGDEKIFIMPDAGCC